MKLLEGFTWWTNLDLLHGINKNGSDHRTLTLVPR